MDPDVSGRPDPDATAAVPLFRRIRYQPALEQRALEALADLDVHRCRALLRELAGHLDLARVDGDQGALIQLLVDVLQRVNRRIHRSPEAEPAYQAHRVDVIERFARCPGPVEAQRRFLECLESLLDPVDARRHPLHPLAERATGYIDLHYGRRLSLSTVAAALAVSPNYLSRLFRRETGITLTAYIHRVRLEHALLLLARGEERLSEIAYRVGYQNYRDFYRNFVKYENAAPRDVRRRLAGA